MVKLVKVTESHRANYGRNNTYTILSSKFQQNTNPNHFL